MNRCWPAAVVLLATAPCAFAADHPRNLDPGPGIATVKTLKQNWTDDESDTFYNIAQGSRLMPYEWFLHLEQADSQTLFRDAENIRKFGYLPRKKGPGNPDALPIGFVEDAKYPDGLRGLGITCAACHTGLVRHRDTAFLIDGAPTLGDFETLLRKLAEALAKTAADDAKFLRFAAAVEPGATPEDQANLRARLRAVAEQRDAYNRRNLPAGPAGRFGHGRVDAFGAIFNEASTTFLRQPQNVQTADAPVSYPCLWDGPQHEKVQWNGAAENRTSDAGLLLFGTKKVGALGRNAGEVLGVFGDVRVDDGPLQFGRYPSTANVKNLIEIEEMLFTLWSPQWPEADFGALDEPRKQQGRELFKTHCLECHADIKRDDRDRVVKFKAAAVGTDTKLAENFERSAETGPLRFRARTLLSPLDRMRKVEPIKAILKHLVERAILRDLPSAAELKPALAAARALPNALDALDALNPGFQQTVTLQLGDRRLVGQFDALRKEGGFYRIAGGNFRLLGPNDPVGAAGGQRADLRSPAGIEKNAGELGESVVRRAAPVFGAEILAEQADAAVPATAAAIAYKSRPLNGVWATAPYLHNGSVRTLEELLKPAAQRAKTFHVGSQEFDPAGVGFKDDPALPALDTTQPGNSNAGHEYGANLSAEERRNLLEYLKSL